MWEPGFNPLVGKIPWRRESLSIPVFWPGEFHGPYSPWGRKESDTTERLSLWVMQDLFSLRRTFENVGCLHSLLGTGADPAPQRLFRGSGEETDRLQSSSYRNHPVFVQYLWECMYPYKSLEDKPLKKFTCHHLVCGGSFFFCLSKQDGITYVIKRKSGEFH